MCSVVNFTLPDDHVSNHVTYRILQVNTTNHEFTNHINEKPVNVNVNVNTNNNELLTITQKISTIIHKNYIM